MQSAVVMTLDELKRHDETVAKETAKQVAETIAKTGGVSEPLPDVVSANWIINHKSIYDLSYGQLNDRHNEIIAELGPKNQICHKRGSVVYYDRRRLDSWLLGREQKKKQDPHLKIMKGGI